jgi:hypothetical protein
MTMPESHPEGIRLVSIDAIQLTPEQQKHVRVLMLLSEGERLADLAKRLTHPRRCILLRLRDSRRASELVHRADDLLGEVARLTGQEHAPLPRGRPMAFDSPLAWWCLQWSFGIWNVSNLLNYLADHRWVLATMSALSLLLCAGWRVPPYRLAKQGKWG